jgi:hypothetical protein
MHALCSCSIHKSIWSHKIVVASSHKAFSNGSASKLPRKDINVKINQHSTKKRMKNLRQCIKIDVRIAHEVF